MDYDNDGDLDLLSGETFGRVHLFLNVGTEKEPKLTAAGFLQVDGDDIDVGQYSSPEVTDWNHDGLWDLLVGGGDGTISLFINEGSLSSPAFLSSDVVMNSGSPLSVSGTATPAMTDLDDDGLPDLIVGEVSYHIRYYHNNGTVGSPVFSGHSMIRENGEPIDFFSYTKPSVVDWNDDGSPDLVVGHKESAVALFLSVEEQIPAPSLGVTFLGPEYIEPSGGTLSFEVSVENPGDEIATFDFYMSVEIDDFEGSEYFLGPLMAEKSIALEPGQRVSTVISRYIPESALPGYYTCRAYVGDAGEWGFTDFETFFFTKLE